MNPLGRIKALTVDTLKSPGSIAGKAVGQAKGAATVGRHLAGQATSRTAGAVTKLVQSRRPPVAPDRPARAATPAAPPVTSIDARADTQQVEATPADVAKAVAKKAPARKPPARNTATNAPTAKSTPGAKLPPRRKAESTSGSDGG